MKTAQAKRTKAPEAYRTIGEVAAETGLEPHVLRYWENSFRILRPMTGAGGRRYYRPQDVSAARALRRLLHVEGYTIKGAQKLISEAGAAAVIEAYGRAPERDSHESPARVLQDVVRAAAAAGLFGAVSTQVEAPSAAPDAPAPIASHAQARLARILVDLDAAKAKLDAARAKTA
jgi:DNA-binding transcriptional MerR regulator